jgi:hypothetical protein
VGLLLLLTAIKSIIKKTVGVTKLKRQKVLGRYLVAAVHIWHQYELRFDGAIKSTFIRALSKSRV